MLSIDWEASLDLNAGFAQAFYRMAGISRLQWACLASVGDRGVGRRRGAGVTSKCRGQLQPKSSINSKLFLHDTGDMFAMLFQLTDSLLNVFAVIAAGLQQSE